MLTDSQLHPLLTPKSDATLRRLRQHPHAPRYTHRIGERLTAENLASIHAFAGTLQSPAPSDHWLPDFLAHCRRDVPFYRSRPAWSDNLANLPLLTRDDLRRQVESFVPDNVPLDNLIVYTTSGTTGASLHLPATPELPNRYLPLFQHALATHGITLATGPNAPIVQVCAQDKTVTNCTIISYLDGAPFAKINLHPDHWNHPDDPVHFLNDLSPQLYTGDPFAFHQLMQLPLTTKPKALLSLATALFPGLRNQLESHFHCPVIDIYSLNEAGPIAFSSPNHPATWQLFPHPIYLEILDENNGPAAPGTRGQITLTGGLNPLLPLVRYATGDYAALNPATRTLTQFEGRPPILFHTTTGRPFNSVDVSTTLHPFPLPTLYLHQNSDGSLLLETNADETLRPPVFAALKILFGPDQIIQWKTNSAQTRSKKPVTYTSETPTFPTKENPSPSYFRL